jgi:poly(A) polymerase
MKKIILLIALSLFILTSKAQDESHWSPSFSAGNWDSNNQYLGGTEIMYLISHKGKIYAANSYWEEYNSDILNNGWAEGCQIFALDSANGQWRESLEIKGSLRIDLFEQLIFTKDNQGNPVNDTLLVAMPTENDSLKSFILNETTGTWIESVVWVNPPTPAISVRAAYVYTDTVTNQQYVFAGIRDIGIIKGQYNPSLPGKIQWDLSVELPVQAGFRVTGFTVVNGTLYASTSENEEAEIYVRNNGPNPSWTSVWYDNTGGGDGDVRALSALPNPNGPGEVVWFNWSSDAIRLDPFNNHAEMVEFNYPQNVSQALGINITGTLSGYNNNVLQWFNPIKQITVQLIGFESLMGNPLQAPSYGSLGSGNGFWLNMGTYYERSQQGSQVIYDLHLIEDNIPEVQDTLVAVRTFCISPFEEDDEKVLYAGGFDANGIPSTETAWIYRGDFRTTENIEESQDMDEMIDIFPNPTNSKLTVQFDQSLDIITTKIQVYNITGKLLMTLQPQSHKQSFELSKYPAGTYLIKVFQDGKVVTKKTIKIPG